MFGGQAPWTVYEEFFVFGSVIAFSDALMTTPWLLAHLGWILDILPIPLRITVRQRALPESP